MQTYAEWIIQISSQTMEFFNSIASLILSKRTHLNMLVFVITWKTKKPVKCEKYKNEFNFCKKSLGAFLILSLSERDLFYEFPQNCSVRKYFRSHEEFFCQIFIHAANISPSRSPFSHGKHVCAEQDEGKTHEKGRWLWKFGKQTLLCAFLVQMCFQWIWNVLCYLSYSRRDGRTKNFGQISCRNFKTIGFIEICCGVCT